MTTDTDFHFKIDQSAADPFHEMLAALDEAFRDGFEMGGLRIRVAPDVVAFAKRGKGIAHYQIIPGGGYSGGPIGEGGVTWHYGQHSLPLEADENLPPGTGVLTGQRLQNLAGPFATVADALKYTEGLSRARQRTRATIEAALPGSGILELAKLLHESGREAVRSACVVNVVPGQGFIEWDDLHEPARQGRILMARYLVAHFAEVVGTLVLANLEEQNRVDTALPRGRTP